MWITRGTQDAAGPTIPGTGWEEAARAGPLRGGVGGADPGRAAARGDPGGAAEGLDPPPRPDPDASPSPNPRPTRRLRPTDRAVAVRSHTLAHRTPRSDPFRRDAVADRAARCGAAAVARRRVDADRQPLSPGPGGRPRSVGARPRGAAGRPAGGGGAVGAGGGRAGRAGRGRLRRRRHLGAEPPVRPLGRAVLGRRPDHRRPRAGPQGAALPGQRRRPGRGRRRPSRRGQRGRRQAGGRAPAAAGDRAQGAGVQRLGLDRIPRGAARAGVQRAARGDDPADGRGRRGARPDQAAEGARAPPGGRRVGVRLPRDRERPRAAQRHGRIDPGADRRGPSRTSSTTR